MAPDYMKDGKSEYLRLSNEIVHLVLRCCENPYQCYIMLWHIREVADKSLQELESWLHENDADGLRTFKYGFEKYKIYQLKP